MSFLYPLKSYTVFEIGNKTITVLGEQHLLNDYTYIKLNDTWLLWQWIYEEMKKNKVLYLETNPNLPLKYLKNNLNTLGINSINIRDCIYSFCMTRQNQFFGADYRRILKNMPPNWDGKLYNTKFIELNFIKLLIQRFEHMQNDIFNTTKNKNIPLKMINNMKIYFNYKIPFIKQTLLNNTISNISFNSIIRTIRYMYSDYTDLCMMRDIVNRNHEDIIILIGNQHAEQLKLLLQEYIVNQNTETINFHVSLK